MTESADETIVGRDIVGSLARSEVRRRSLAGVFYLTASSFLNLLIGLCASLALARMLAPRDFGVVAIGSTAVLLANALVDGGLGAAMVKRSAPPTREELRTVNGIQLALASMFCIPGIAVALLFGRTGAITAVMIASLPISLLQTPGRIMLTRQMRYDRQLVIDFTSQTSLQVSSVAAVALGASVWGLAFGQVLKAVVATTMMAALSVRLERPSLRNWRSYGPVMRFGLSFQASWFTFVGREQGLNIAVAGLGGVTPLGIWTFANRIFQLPSLAFNSLYVVGFPAMSNLLARGEDPAEVVLRTVRRAAIAGAFVFPTFAAASPQLIPSVFGGRWRDVADIVPLICLSTLLLGPIAVAATSYLSAAGRPGIVAWASASFGIVWIAVAATLLPVIGVTAIGVGNLAGAVLEAWILDCATRRTAGVAPHRPLLRPLAVGMVAGVAGWLLSVRGPSGVLTGLLAAGLTVLISVCGLQVACRADLHDAFRLVAEVVRSVLPRVRRAAVDGAGPGSRPTDAAGPP